MRLARLMWKLRGDVTSEANVISGAHLKPAV